MQHDIRRKNSAVETWCHNSKGIEKCKNVIEGPLDSKYLGVVRTDENA